jgi:hypothetical protein
MISDEQLNSRLLEVCGFEPWDKFEHCRHMLREGWVDVRDNRTHFLNKSNITGFRKWVQINGGRLKGKMALVKR